MSGSEFHDPILIAAIDKARKELFVALDEQASVARKVEIKRAVYTALAELDPEYAAQSRSEVKESFQKTSMLPLRRAPLPRTEGVRGKAPGTLSNQWRAIMGAFVVGGNFASPPETWRGIAMHAGYDIDTKTARDWLRRTAKSEHRYIQQIEDGYRVSDLAIEKFGLRNWTKNESAPSIEEADISSSDQSAASQGESAEAGTSTEKGD